MLQFRAGPYTALVLVLSAGLAQRVQHPKFFPFSTLQGSKLSLVVPRGPGFTEPRPTIRYEPAEIMMEKGFPPPDASSSQGRQAVREHPILSIPGELLIKIFDFGIALAREDVTLGERERRLIFTVSQVCSTWRQLTLSTPSLWSSILYLRNDWRPNVVDIMVERSGSSRIDLMFLPPHLRRDDEHKVEEQLQIAINLVDRIRFLCPRLRSIQWEIQELGVLETLISMLQSNNHPALQCIDLRVPEHPGGCGVQNSQPYNRHQMERLMKSGSNHIYSSLSRIIFQYVPLSYFPTDMFSHLRHAQLSFPGPSLRFVSLTTPQLILFLQNTPHLEELEIDSNAFFGKRLVPSELDLPVLLPCLMQSVWKGAHPDSVHNLLALLDLPKIQLLDVTINDHYNPVVFPIDDPPHVTSLLDLRELVVRFQERENVDVITSKLYLSTLERLELAYIGKYIGISTSQYPCIPACGSVFVSSGGKLSNLTELILSDLALRKVPSEDTAFEHLPLRSLTLICCPDVLYCDLVKLIEFRSERYQRGAIDEIRSEKLIAGSAVSSQAGRKIRPLPKMRRTAVVAPTVSPVSVKQGEILDYENFLPARLAQMYIRDCPLISKEQVDASAARELGTVTTHGHLQRYDATAPTHTQRSPERTPRSGFNGALLWISWDHKKEEQKRIARSKHSRKSHV
ncbi:hypothetical protein CONPUDRAFT_76869 [Coniophora puteana RWD-64-598 SS2]|uniref:F-box domain-containing protein n=1 Tax=Coniophora puteana (strain RWD-64-598) TaxID=741705 RepID=A0A5M3M9L1_CONPW|nr:uncharacterized protein CONPUDRAFT_76869 [Coniophora puteana RWD-64-598 SS2]EIW75793.1 hypothetical protein CONPUDRAFT_76869 [Coniophora puteana RWD-64-598 SS2]